MTEFHPFLMERMMSKFEQDVDYNLSESGVHPVLLRELLRDNADQLQALLDTELNYPHVNGIPELRERIAGLYDGAGAENVLVTVGAAEANYLSVRTMLNTGDEIVMMLPNYMQIWGVAKNHGLRVRSFRLLEEAGWAADVAELQEAVSEDTKLIAVCNPNNPTGHILSEGEMTAIVDTAEATGAWILADEVYRGAEREREQETPSFYGRYDKVLAVGGMSKAYGLPGLRMGWVVGPVATIDELWARHEYVTISSTMLSNRLATIALSPEVRPRLVARARDYIRRGYATLQEWIDDHGDTFRLKAHEAAAIAFAGYELDINSTMFAESLIEQKSVLIVPGDHFGMDRFVRISFGVPHDHLVAALDRIHEFIEEMGGTR
jgi:aspartate/methionine/tyrosine aminotransferase